ncbi:hypothetical protein C0J50_6600 [Silurus asotus]|uniref:Ig-like domain-containing protein n=1 Tax=Silurus asotus TaxID=30991 RepID=A0AAD5A2A5_SILAS|nr:hypothetical protein C0J50_6600 [Silurus asotus]
MMKCLYFLSVVFHVAAGCDLSGDNDSIPITSYKGRSVLLPCSCFDLHSKPQTFTWEVYKTENLTEVLNDEHYRDRYQLFNSISPANLSLLISDLREEDQGFYWCNTEKKSTLFTLYVNGCELVKKTVVEEVTGFTGESVVLPCFCTDLQDDPKTIKWEFFNGSNDQDIYPEQTGHHKLVNKNHPGNLSLLISDLTEEDQGIYTCNIQNDWTYVYLNVEGDILPTKYPESELLFYAKLGPSPYTTAHITAFLDTLHDMLTVQRPENTRYVIIWDNVSFHRAALVRNWLTDHPSFMALNLPPYSPFLNPIEEFFSAWRWKVYDRHPHQQVALLQAIEEACGDIDQASCQAWIRHLRRYFPRCLGLEDIACDVDEILWPEPERRHDVG